MLKTTATIMGKYCHRNVLVNGNAEILGANWIPWSCCERRRRYWRMAMRDNDSRIEKHSTEGRSAFGCHVGGFVFLGHDNLERKVEVRDFGFSSWISGETVDEDKLVVVASGCNFALEDNMLRKDRIEST
jgi:hypothetical protein